ncbi:hypothetical protein [Aliiruegeria sabulilitoris]
MDDTIRFSLANSHVHGVDDQLGLQVGSQGPIIEAEKMGRR